MRFTKPIARIIPLVPSAIATGMYGGFGFGGGNSCYPQEECGEYGTLDDALYYNYCDGESGHVHGSPSGGDCPTGTCGTGSGSSPITPMAQAQAMMGGGITSMGPGPAMGGSGPSCGPATPYYSEREYGDISVQNMGSLDTSSFYCNAPPAQSSGGSAQSFGGSAQSFGGSQAQSFGGSSQSFGGSSQSFCGPAPAAAQSFGGSAQAAQSFGGSSGTSTPLPLGGACPSSSGQSSPVTLVLNGEVPVEMIPQSVTVGETTYPLSNPAMGSGTVSVSNLHTPEEIAAGIAGMSPAQIAEAEAAAANQTGNATNKTGKKGKKSSKSKAAKKGKKKNGAAGMTVVAALAVLPITLFLM